MRYLFSDGFEQYAVATDLNQRWSSQEGSQAFSGSDTAFGTGKAMEMTSGRVSRALGSNEAELLMTFRLKHTVGNSAGNVFTLFVFDGQTRQFGLQFGQDGHLGIIYNGPTIIIPGLWPTGIHESWQIYAVAGETGHLKICKNGGLTPVYEGNLNLLGSNHPYFNAFAFDDQCDGKIIVDDVFVAAPTGAEPAGTLLPDLRCIGQTVTASTSTGFTATGAASNQAAVLTLDGDASFISSNTLGAKDVYTLSAVPADLDVYGVAGMAAMCKPDAGARTGTVSLILGGAETIIASNDSIGNGYQITAGFARTPPGFPEWTTGLVNTPLSIAVAIGA